MKITRITELVSASLVKIVEGVSAESMKVSF
jgi:hypothetical protein